MPRGNQRQKILDEAQWRSTAEEDMLDKRKQEREDRNNSYGGEEMPDVEVAYVVMDANHSQADHVGRTRLAKLCGSRDDSLSWNLSRVKQDGAIRADLDETEALGPPTDNGATNRLLEAGRLLQRRAVPRALAQVGCPSPRLAREGRGVPCHGPPAQRLQQLVQLLVKAKQALLQVAGLLNLLGALLALVRLVGRRDSVMAIGVFRPPAPTGRAPPARQGLAQQRCLAPHNLSAVDTRHAPLPC